MKKFSIIIMVVFVIVFAVTSCKKENETTMNAKQQAGMLHFNSAEEFAQTREKVMKMTETERRAWEQQQGFKSYATKCNELLDELETIKTHDEIVRFVENHNDYFRLDGETIYVNLFDSPYFYLIDENRLWKAGDKCIKVCNNGIYYTQSDDIDELFNIKDNVTTSSNNVTFVPLSSNNLDDINQIDSAYAQRADGYESLGNTIYYKGIRATRTSFSQGNRNNIELKETEVYFPPTETGPGAYFTDLFVWNYPQHRVAGFWFACNRTMTIDISVNYTFEGISHTVPFDTIHKGYNTRLDLEDAPYRVSNYSFNIFTGTASTPDTPTMSNFDSRLSNFGLAE